MAFEIAKGNYISRIWFLADPRGGGGMDVFAHLWRRLPEGPWTLEYRFRYYEDDRAHDSKDRKSGYRGTFNDPLSEAQVIKKVEVALRTILEFLPEGFAMDATVVETDEPEVVTRLLAQKPYMHIKFEELTS